MSFADTDLNIELEPFVEEVRKRQQLWNINCVEYREKNKRRKAWEEICRIFYKDFDKKSNVEKSGISFSMSSKWRNLRDNYMRVQRKATTNKTSRRPYIHRNLLNFLDKVAEEKNKENHKEVESNPEEDEVEMIQIPEDEEIDIKPDITIDNVMKGYYSEEPEPSERSIIHEEDDDDDMAFYRSTLPMVRNMSQEQKIEFRIQVMNLIRKSFLVKIPIQ